MRTWKLNDSVPTSAIMASGIHSPGLRADVAQRGAQLAAGALHRRRVRSAAGSIRRRATSMATKDSALRAKHVLDAGEGDDRAGAGGPDDPRALDDDRVQRDGVDHALGADQLDDEALARRVVDRVDRAADEDERPDHRAGSPSRRP